MLALFYQLRNCNLFTQHVIYFMERHHWWTVDPGPFLLHCYYRLPFTCFIYILANYYLLPLDTLNPLFTSNRWDWQPHCELGQSTWLCCVQVPRCCWCKAKPWTSYLAPLSRAVAKLAGIHLQKFGSFSYWFDKPWFHNWGKTCCCAHHNLLLGFPTGRLYIYIYNSCINTAPPLTGGSRMWGYLKKKRVCYLDLFCSTWLLLAFIFIATPEIWIWTSYGWGSMLTGGYLMSASIYISVVVSLN
jgi:hypothetical protein